MFLHRHRGVVFLLLLLGVLDQCEQLAEVIIAVILEDGHAELEAFTTAQQLQEVFVQWILLLTVLCFSSRFLSSF